MAKYSGDPQLKEYLARLDARLADEAAAADPECARFLEAYTESHGEGEPASRGLAALYWRWLSEGGWSMDRRAYEMRRDSFAGSLPSVKLDGEVRNGRFLAQEFMWWSAQEWVMVDSLVEAVLSFHRDGRV